MPFLPYPFPILFLLLRFVDSQQINPFLKAHPKLECLPDGLRLHLNPLGAFRGHVYVKGFFAGSQSHLNYCDSPVVNPFFIHVPYRGDCVVDRQRVISPSGVNYQVTVVVQHHRFFVTAGDRAYRLNCFYQQQDIDVEQEVTVNDLQLINVEGHAQPICRYDVLSESIHGPKIKFANVGDPIVHKWTCESNDTAFLVHSCVVKDGQGKEYRLVDERGCVADESLVAPIQYSSDFGTAFTTINAFRFADQVMVHFTCQLTLCRRKENGCEGIVPPSCHPLPLGPIKTTYRTPGPEEKQAKLPTTVINANYNRTGMQVDKEESTEPSIPSTVSSVSTLAPPRRPQPSPPSPPDTLSPIVPSSLRPPSSTLSPIPSSLRPPSATLSPPVSFPTPSISTTVSPPTGSMTWSSKGGGASTLQLVTASWTTTTTTSTTPISTTTTVPSAAPTIVTRPTSRFSTLPSSMFTATSRPTTSFRTTTRTATRPWTTRTPLSTSTSTTTTPSTTTVFFKETFAIFEKEKEAIRHPEGHYDYFTTQKTVTNEMTKPGGANTMPEGWRTNPNPNPDPFTAKVSQPETERTYTYPVRVDPNNMRTFTEGKTTDGRSSLPFRIVYPEAETEASYYARLRQMVNTPIPSPDQPETYPTAPLTPSDAYAADAQQNMQQQLQQPQQQQQQPQQVQYIIPVTAYQVYPMPYGTGSTRIQRTVESSEYGENDDDFDMEIDEGDEKTMGMTTIRASYKGTVPTSTLPSGRSPIGVNAPNGGVPDTGPRKARAHDSNETLRKITMDVASEQMIILSKEEGFSHHPSPQILPYSTVISDCHHLIVVQFVTIAVFVILQIVTLLIVYYQRRSYREKLEKLEHLKNDRECGFE